MTEVKKIRLNIDGISKSYPGRKIFADVSANVESGKRLVVTGPNGSGKSTLIRIICRLIRPTKGKIELSYDDKIIKDIEIRNYIGLVSPDLVLYDELSAIENLGFFSHVAGFPLTRKEIKDKLDFVGLSGRGDDLVGSYSSGMKQRLKYCLALSRNPEVLILDEPTANLDDAGKALVDSIIKSHNGIAVIATNEKSEWGYGDQILRLGA